MLRIYPVILDWIETVAPLIRELETRDRDLADQLRRSAKSVGLNVREGMLATGRARTQCYRIAAREMSEAVGAIEIAARLGDLTMPTGEDFERQERILATLAKLARLPRN